MSAGEIMSPSGGTRSKRFGSRSLAEYVNREIDPLVARQGFGESSLLLRWREIVGARTAAMCEPARLQWPPRAKQRSDKQRSDKHRSDKHRSDKHRSDKTAELAQEPATLVLRVEPGFGLDIQHMSPAIIERVNAHLGWRCVARVALRQEPLRGAAPKARPAPPRDTAARARAAAATEGVADDALRAALITLGERALASPHRENGG